MRKIIPTLAASLAAALALTACGSSTPSTTPSGTDTPAATKSGAPAGEVTVVKVGASAVPHAQILAYIDDNLAAGAGIDLEVTEFDDYVLPNEALADGTLDANYFQHLPYLEAEIAEKGYAFEHGAGVHIEPLSLFSSKHATPADIPEGGWIAITNDVSNQNRGLKLLEKAGLLANIDDETSVLSLEGNAEQNPKGLQFEETQPEVVVTLIDDPKVDAAVVNSNFILTAGLNTDEAIDVESVEGNPYANILAWRTDNTNEGVAVLEGLLHSPEVVEFIRTTWPSGNVLPGAAS